MVKEIPLTRDKFAIVDDADYEGLAQFCWIAIYNKSTRSWLARRTQKLGVRRYKSVAMHREIMGVGPEEEVDHENHNTLDNRRTNLRICSHAQNSANRRIRSDSTSGFKGVYWSKPMNRWCAHIATQKDGQVFLGGYKSKADAARAYDACARFLFGEFALTNFKGDEAVAPDVLRERASKHAWEERKQKTSSRFIGVSWHAAKHKWVARFYQNKRTYQLGSFEREQDAADAVQRAKSNYLFEKKPSLGCR